MQKRVSSPAMRLESSLISTGGGGGSVVLFVSPSSFIDIQNRYLLNVERENMTVEVELQKSHESGPRDTQRVCFGVF